jgi:hypothetical protein
MKVMPFPRREIATGSMADPAQATCRTNKQRVAVLLWVSCVVVATFAQDSTPTDALQQHFDTAQKSQSAGDLDQAAAEYRKFLAVALQRIAAGRANMGGATKALPLLE